MSDYELSPEMRARLDRTINAEIIARIQRVLRADGELLDRAIVEGTDSLTPKERETVLGMMSENNPNISQSQ